MLIHNTNDMLRNNTNLNAMQIKLMNKIENKAKSAKLLKHDHFYTDLISFTNDSRWCLRLQ